jgi:hypothetical protein
LRGENFINIGRREKKMSKSTAWKDLFESSIKYISLSHYPLLGYLCNLLPEERAGSERLKNAVAIVDVFWLVKQLDFDKISESYRDWFECKCSLTDRGYTITISIGSINRSIPRTSVKKYLDDASNKNIVVKYEMPGVRQQSIKGSLNVNFTQTVLQALSSSVKPSHGEIREAIVKGMEYLRDGNNRVGRFWSPYPGVNMGGIATCDAIAALTYPIVGYGTIDILRQQGNVLALSEEGVKTFCNLIKEESMWTEEGLLKAGTDIPTQSSVPFVSINADLILCYYAVTKAMEIFGKGSEENECLRELESFKDDRLSKIVDWLLKQQVIDSGLWVENKSISCTNIESLITTSFAIRALSLDWKLRLRRTSKAGEVKGKIVRGVDALKKWLEDKIKIYINQRETDSESSYLKLSELAYSLSSIIETSINLELEIPEIIRKYPNILLDKVHELLRNLPDRCTDEEEICNYSVTYSTLGPALIALVKCYEVFGTIPSPREGEKGVMMELVKPRLCYYADILARVGCEILKEKGCMAERRGGDFQPATSATASLIIALVEYDAKMNVSA